MAKNQKISTTILQSLIKNDLGLESKREFKFHPKRQWRIDLAVFCPNCKIAIELEGGVFTGGRHTNSMGFLGDIEKYNSAAIHGWKLLRYTHTHHGYHDILKDIKILMESE